MTCAKSTVKKIVGWHQTNGTICLRWAVCTFFFQIPLKTRHRKPAELGFAGGCGGERRPGRIRYPEDWDRLNATVALWALGGRLMLLMGCLFCFGHWRRTETMTVTVGMAGS